MQNKLHVPRVLVVEDNPGDVLLIKESFRDFKRPCDLSFARDGQEALDFVHRIGAHSGAARPDLILLDLNLPKLSGHDVLAYLKSTPEFQQIPVVVLSTSSAPKDIEQAYAAAANCYCCKPDHLDEFFQLMHRLQEFWLESAQLVDAA